MVEPFPPVGFSPKSKTMRVAKVKEIFQHLLARAQEVEWEGLRLKKVSNLSDLSEELGKDRNYCYQMFVRGHGLLISIPMGEPEEYFIFEDYSKADE
jgi:hypothetical protein